MLATLIPVSQWTWNLYVIRYLNERNETVRCDLVVETDRHIENRLWEDGTPTQADYAEWWQVLENVPQPLIVGSYYGLPLSEDGRTAADRLYPGRLP